MLRLCITGGIGTGKSEFIAQLRALAPQEAFFDCDACVHQLYREPDFVGLLARRFGSQIVADDGQIERRQLRDLVLNDPERRKGLEALVHPEVRRRCQGTAEQAEKEGKSLFVAEVPLLYESGFDVPRDLEVVVAASRRTQIERLAQKRNLASEVATQLLAAQLPIEEKMKRAHVVIWNEGTLASLIRQAHLLLQRVTELKLMSS